MLKYIILIVIIYSTYYVNADCDPEWDDYNGERCLKHFPGHLLNYQSALGYCSRQGGTLLTIHSQNEQDFITNLFFVQHKIVDTIWLGAHVLNKVITWVDGSKLEYSNWIEGKPSNITNECVQMNHDDSNIGKWSDEPCAKSNLVVCQKLQPWSLEHIQEILLDNQKRLDIVEVGVSVGFVYAQLPGQPDPKTIWPNAVWENITPKYAGLFFRAEGGKSAVFEKGTQAESSPRLTNVINYPDAENPHVITITPGIESKHLWTGTMAAGTGISLSFIVSNDEVRPQNQAIRIWKRVK